MHTVGYPLPRAAFGGGFFYPMGRGTLGARHGGRARRPDGGARCPRTLQRLKTHPLVEPHLQGGECLEWGARLIPEGGAGSLPRRLSGEGVLLVGDAAGFVDVPSLKGIHYAMLSGILAADAADAHLRAGVPLSMYDAALEDSPILADLRRSRNMRPAFQRGFWSGIAVSALATLTGGALPRGTLAVEEDAAAPRSVPDPENTGPGGAATGRGLSKLDGVFLSGNNTRDDLPSHLVVPPRVSPETAALWERMCPAGFTKRVRMGSRCIRRTAWIAAPPMCWGPAGRRGKAAPAPAGAGCSEPPTAPAARTAGTGAARRSAGRAGRPAPPSGRSGFPREVVEQVNRGQHPPPPGLPR